MANITGTNGNDTLTGTFQADSISGLDGDDTLRGRLGDDTLDGGVGADTLIGGVGDDIYFADSLDTIVEAAGHGNDRVLVTGTFALANGVDIETIQVFTTQGTHVSGNDTAGQVLIGNFGNDLLSAKAVGTTLIGGAGNDTYEVNSDDVIVETLNAGIDAVKFDPTSGSSTAFTLSASVENLFFSNINTSASQITGNDLDNIIGNSNGADTLLGLGGDDVLNGGAGADVLVGGAGNDVLVGGAGGDTMTGGTGDDSYDVNDIGDVLTENAGEGIDRAFILIDNVTLAANIEVGFFAGTAGTAGFRLTGNDQSNTLFGDVGDDTLIGGVGADVLKGGVGNDTYIVDDQGDLVFEAFVGGLDVVDASVTYALTTGQAIEVLQLSTGANTSATGNEFANTIVGNAGSNILDGLQGNDVLIGLAGNDAFRFGSGFGLDQILDFEGAGVAGGDTVLLQNSGLTSFNEVLPFITDIQGGCQIALNGTDVLTIANVSKAQFNADDFLFS